MLQEVDEVMQSDDINWTEPELRSGQSGTTLKPSLKYFWFEIFFDTGEINKRMTLRSREAKNA